MAHEKLRPQYFFDEEKIAHLKQLAPECFEDGKINFETLKQNLGDWAENEEDLELEHFGLFWPGKRDARKAAALPPEGTLEPVWGDGLKADGTPDTDGENDSKNVFIEGENLEVLKLLQKSYASKIKMIYIDPPYNTGNDFVYDDDFTEPLQEYLRRTGQVDEEGKSLTTNKKSDGRFHSKWLSMMYPRLRLARNLLREDGVIFVSIDDNEAHNLRAIMNEIFGEENIIANLIWANKEGGGSSDSKYFRVKHESIICFSKNMELVEIRGVDISNRERYKSSDEYEKERGPYYLQKLGMGSIQYSKSLDYPILGPDKKEIYPADNNSGKKACWRWSEKKFEWGVKNGFIEIKEDSKGQFTVYTKQYLNCDNEGKIIERTQRPFGIIDDFSSTQASKTLDKLGIGSFFDYSKPLELLKYLIELTTNSNDIILDFFAGSGTLAHSTFESNFERSSENKFICVQIPFELEEKSEAFKSGFKTISDISKKRIKLVSNGYHDGQKKINTDIGFKSFSLLNSNFKKWEDYKNKSISDLENKLALFNESPLNDNFTNDGLLIEIILLEGFTLCSKVSNLLELKTNTIKKITSEYCQHSLLICLDEKIAPETISNLHLNDDDIFICLDSAITTEDKLRLSDKGLIKTI